VISMLGIIIVVAAFAVKYSGNLWPLFTKAVGGLKTWFTTKKQIVVTAPASQSDVPTAQDAFAGLQLVVKFLNQAVNDPAHGIIKAALDKAQQEAK